MNDVIAMVEESANSFATYRWIQHQRRHFSRRGWYTSPILRMFSLRSFSEKARSLFKPKRMLSPSRRYAAYPRCKRCCSSAVAIVDFPDADRPVNQIVKPCCFRKEFLSCRDSDGCHVMLLSSVSAQELQGLLLPLNRVKGQSTLTYVAMRYDFLMKPLFGKKGSYGRL